MADRLRAAERRAGVAPVIAQDVHRICGQLCGQAAQTGVAAAFQQLPGFVAENLSIEKPFQINTLHEYVDLMTWSVRGLALSGAAVDFQTRAGRGCSLD